MLESVVARLLNQWLGKYVLDLDTENLNIGIFSGNVQLTELRLKPEALYELNLPIQVTFGTIGRLSIKIPWNSFLNQSIVILVEDVHVLVEPISSTKLDNETNKRLMRATKRKILSDLYNENNFNFSEKLINFLMNNFQVTVQNVHIRYEDRISSSDKNISAGLCVNNFSIETTNNKWKACKMTKNSTTGYHLLKIDSFFVYWNHCCQLQTWDWKTKYYLWRNYMTNSLQTFTINDELMEFLVKPMTCKIKLMVHKTAAAESPKLLIDIVLQDLSAQLTQQQLTSIRLVKSTFSRLNKTREFMHLRPETDFGTDSSVAKWWHYATNVLLENRWRKYNWETIKHTRNCYRLYKDAYLKLTANPNNTELKMDCQLLEDGLDIFLIVLAREHVKLLIAEETLICLDEIPEIISKINLTVSNLSLTLLNTNREIFCCHLSQFSSSIQMNITKWQLKTINCGTEKVQIEGATKDDLLLPILCSQMDFNEQQMASNIFSFDLERGVENEWKVWFWLETVEVTFHAYAIKELFKFFENDKIYFNKNISEYCSTFLTSVKGIFKKLLNSNVELHFDIKIPCFVIPEFGSITQTGYVLIIDFGHLKVATLHSQLNADEEFSYFRITSSFQHVQILFCDWTENWRDSLKEIDTEMHFLTKMDFEVILLAPTIQDEQQLQFKLQINVPSFKINFIERKIISFLDYYKNIHSLILDLSNYWPGEIIKNKNRCQIKQLKKIVNCLVKGEVKKINLKRIPSSFKTSVYYDAQQINQDFSTSECSDEQTPDFWANPFHTEINDSLSTSNQICRHLKIVCGEICFVYSRSCVQVDHQYLMIRFGNFVADLATTTFGFVTLMSLHSFIFTDKLHCGPAGQYLDFVHIVKDSLLLIFQHVRSNCPDFKTKYCNTENSLLVELGKIECLIQKDAIRSLVTYFQYLKEKLNKQSNEVFSEIRKKLFSFYNNVLLENLKAPPLPFGAIKSSKLYRVNQISVNLCNSDREIINCYVNNIEIGVVLRVNSKKTIHGSVGLFQAERLSEELFYQKIIYTEDEKLFDFKFVYPGTNLGLLKLTFGRVYITVLCNLLKQLKCFCLPVFSSNFFIKNVENIQLKVKKFANPGLKSNFTLNVNIEGPVFLIPQKNDSPNLIIVNFGFLSLENYLKEQWLENILVKISNITISRALTTFTGSIETQDIILEPLNVRLDAKRIISNSQNQFSAWELLSVIDLIKLDVSQKDLNVLFAIIDGNINEPKVLDFSPNFEGIKNLNDEPFDNSDLTCLEAFFCQAESKHRKISLKIEFEGILLILFCDSEEILSSPVRDLNKELCRLEISEFILLSDFNFNKTVELNFKIETIKISDLNKTILETDNIPILNLTFRQNIEKTKTIDIGLNKIKILLNTYIIMTFYRFLLGILPVDRERKKKNNYFENPGFVYDSTLKLNVIDKKSIFSSNFNLNFNFQQIDIIYSSEKDKSFLIKFQGVLDLFTNRNRRNFKFILTFFEIFFKSTLKVLKPCNFEFSEDTQLKENTKIEFFMSNLEIIINPEMFLTLTDISKEFKNHFNLEIEENQFILENPKKKQGVCNTDMENIWSPKKLPKTTFSSFSHDIKEVKTENDIKTVDFFASIKCISVVFELQVPILLLNANLEAHLHDFCPKVNGNLEIQLQMNYYNDTTNSWEPLIEPISIEEGNYIPWSIFCQIIHCPSTALYCQNVQKINVPVSGNTSDSSSSSSSDTKMTFFHPPTRSSASKISEKPTRLISNLSAFFDDAATELNNDTMTPLSSAICDLFTGDWNESYDSDYERSSQSDEASDMDDQDDDFQRHSSSLVILINARDVLNINITTKNLQIFEQIFQVYSGLTPYGPKIHNKNAITLQNKIGSGARIDLILRPNNIIVNSCAYEEDLDSNSNSPSSCGTPVEVDGVENSLNEYLQFFDSRLLHPTEVAIPEILKISIPRQKTICLTCPKRCWRRLISIGSYNLVVQQQIGYSGRQITVCSPLTFINLTFYSIGLWCDLKQLEAIGYSATKYLGNPFEGKAQIGLIGPQNSYTLPLEITYKCNIYVHVPTLSNSVSNEFISWNKLPEQLDLICAAKSLKPEENFTIRACVNQLNNQLDYNVQLLPPVEVKNLLPLQITVNVATTSFKVDVGEEVSFHSINIQKNFRLTFDIDYVGQVWKTSIIISPDLNEKIISFSPESDTDGGNKQLSIILLINRNQNCKINLCASYWIINKTTLGLQLRWGTDRIVYDVPTNESPLILTTNKRSCSSSILFGARLRVFQSNWSQEFNLDAVETSGIVICKDRERKRRYNLLLNLKICKICPMKTKIVVLLPAYTISNITSKNLRFMEENDKVDFWIDLFQNCTIPFYPETSAILLKIKLENGMIISKHFSGFKAQKTVLKLDHGFTVTVEVKVSQNKPLSIIFRPFQRGDAPLLIKNYCTNLHLKFQQKGQNSIDLVGPQMSVFYTWDDPSNERILYWNVSNNKCSGNILNFTKNNYGKEKFYLQTFQGKPVKVNDYSSSSSDSDENAKNSSQVKIQKNKVHIYWISYLEQNQRIVSFFQNEFMFSNLKNEIFDADCNLELYGALTEIKVSFCIQDNKENGFINELMTLRLDPSPSIWEVHIAKKWKLLTLELAAWLEDKYQETGHKFQLSDCCHVDFDKMQMIKPVFGELRRTVIPSIWWQFRHTERKQFFRLRINSIEVISNQINIFKCTNKPSSPSGIPCFNMLLINNVDSKCANVFNLEALQISLNNVYINFNSEACNFLKHFSLQQNNKFLRFLKSDLSNIHQTLNNFDVKNKILKTNWLKMNGFDIQVSLDDLNNEQLLDLGKHFSYLGEYLVANLELVGNYSKIINFSIPQLKVTNKPSNCSTIMEHILTALFTQFHVYALNQSVLLNELFVINEVESELESSPLPAYEHCANEAERNWRTQLGVVVGAGENVQAARNTSLVGQKGTTVLPVAVLKDERNYLIGLTLTFGPTIERFLQTGGKALLPLLTNAIISNVPRAVNDSLRRAALLGEVSSCVLWNPLQRAIPFGGSLKPQSIHDDLGFGLLQKEHITQKDIIWDWASIGNQKIILITLSKIVLYRILRLFAPLERLWIVNLDDISSLEDSIKEAPYKLIIFTRSMKETLKENTYVIESNDVEIINWLKLKIQQALVISTDFKCWEPLE